MLRLHLPPNLAAAAPRDAIPLKVDLDLAQPPAPELWPALALLQRWCGTPTPPKFLQLTRAQLRELVSVLSTQPVFVEDGRLTSFRQHVLLAEKAPPPPVATAPASSRRPAATGTPMSVDGSEHFLAIALPSREHPSYSAALELVKSHGFVLEPSNRKWWLRDRHKTLNFLADQGRRLREEFHATFTPNFERNTARVQFAEVAAEIVDRDSDYDLTLSLRAGEAADDTVRSAVASRRGYVEDRGRIFLLDPGKLQQLETVQRALAGSPGVALATRRTQRISRARVAETQDLLEALSPSFQPPESWRARTDALRHLSQLPPAPIPRDLDVALRPYQRLGVAWLWHLHRQELGGILADEMGLGKTLQALALLTAVATETPARGGRRPHLVVTPASLLENWRREATRFAPGLKLFVHHGDRRLATTGDVAAHDLVITSYGTLTRDWELFSKVDFACVIADEAQHIKNRRSQNAAALRSLRARSRFLLTGTPLENSLDDLRSLFEFLLPGYIDRLPAGLRADERAWFDDRLRAKVAPYLLRRTKQAVAPELPEKLEQVLWCELTPAQARLYRETQERTERELFDLQAGGASEQRLRLAMLTQLLRLRQICCDPRLVAAPDSVVSDAAAFSESGKLEAFRELLAEAIDDGHRLLVFSQFTSLLGLLRTELAAQEIAHCYLDGSMAPRARQAEVDRFQSSPEIPLFLISLKAGGTGLNLTGADTVVHFDPWWNPAAEAQATDRAHRIGQTRVVTSYKLIASGTVEEKVLTLQEEKRALLAHVFEASDELSSRLTLADLQALLR